MYLGNVSSFWKLPELCGKWLRSVGSDSNMWGNDLIIWQKAWKCGKWFRDFGNRKNIWEEA